MISAGGSVPPAGSWDGPAGFQEALEQAGAYFQGHFALTSGRHSDRFFLLPRLFQHPELASPWTAALAQRLRYLEAETAVGPATGGIILSYEVARHLGWKAMFAEKTGRSAGSSGHQEMALRRGFALRPGEKVVIVEDVITTGGSVRSAMKAVEAAGGTVVGVGALIDRSGGRASLGPRQIALWTMDSPDWEPDDCPLCRQGIPLTELKIGSGPEVAKP